jgi:uncharacterized protein (DUF697 family)
MYVNLLTKTFGDFVSAIKSISIISRIVLSVSFGMALDTYVGKYIPVLVTIGML